MIRGKLADIIRDGGEDCDDCDDSLGSIYVRHWHMTIERPWTWLLPEVERTCFECAVDREVAQYTEADR